MMRVQGNVKSIVLGGRPTSKQIQAIGGVKGAQFLDHGNLFNIAQFFVQNQADNTVMSTLASLSDLPSNRSVDNGVNFSDQILAADVSTGLPAQFVREVADCRLFFTPKMILNVTEMWEAAANVAWGGASCVAGGLSQGIVSARNEAPRTKEAIIEMTQAAADARSYLDEVKLKAATTKVERMPGWAGLHGRMIPNLYVA